MYKLHYNYKILTLHNLQLTIRESTYTLINSEFTIVTYKMLFYITYLQYSTYYIRHYLLTKPCIKLLSFLQYAILLT